PSLRLSRTAMAPLARIGHICCARLRQPRRRRCRRRANGAGSSMATRRGIEQAVPNSAGTAPPRTPAPLNAADCHIHIYDPRFAPRVERVTQATVSDYRLLQKHLGLMRVVIVHPRNYQVDIGVTLDAI